MHPGKKVRRRISASSGGVGYSVLPHPAAGSFADKKSYIRGRFRPGNGRPAQIPEGSAADFQRRHRCGSALVYAAIWLVNFACNPSSGTDS